MFTENKYLIHTKTNCLSTMFLTTMTVIRNRSQFQTDIYRKFEVSKTREYDKRHNYQAKYFWEISLSEPMKTKTFLFRLLKQLKTEN